MQLHQECLDRLGADVGLYGASLSACAAGAQWRQALRLLAAAPGSAACRAAAMTACGRAAEWRRALRLLAEGLPVDFAQEARSSGRWLGSGEAEVAYCAAISATWPSLLRQL